MIRIELVDDLQFVCVCVFLVTLFHHRENEKFPQKGERSIASTIRAIVPSLKMQILHVLDENRNCMKEKCFTIYYAYRV